jgi:hypothetical protein
MRSRRRAPRTKTGEAQGRAALYRAQSLRSAAYPSLRAHMPVRDTLVANRTPKRLARMRASVRTRVRVRADTRAEAERADQKVMMGPDGGESRGWPCARKWDMQRTSRSACGRRMGKWGSSEGGATCGNVSCARGAVGVNVREDSWHASKRYGG